ncbi:hypothetical protein C8Q76DRAFT_627077 [Earliella scabrosa]|nr:hypothetical protein C8Q76DRAFT_627077 [Earliella scabrosa]
MVALLAFLPLLVIYNGRWLCPPLAQIIQRFASQVTPSLSFSRPVAHERIPWHLRQYVDAAIEKALLEQIGQRDHASEQYGTRIVLSLTTNNSIPIPTTSSHPARVILRDSFGGGPCWLITSNQGQVGISLPEVVYPTGVTVDHIPSLDTVGRRRAPRNLRLWGALDGKANVKRYDSIQSSFPPVLHTGPPVRQGNTFLLLADFEYQMLSKHVQTFPIFEHVQDSQLVFGLFVLEVVDNWGDSHTCIHRLRIHGRT